MSNNISLTASMRSNLLSLQNIAGQVDLTQNRLSTGLKVNSAIDNPSSYYTAVSLNNRASDLSALLDSMAQGIQTIKAATEGLQAGASLLEQASATATQALETVNIPSKSWFEAQEGVAAVVSSKEELLAAIDSGKKGDIVIYGQIDMGNTAITLQEGQNLTGIGAYGIADNERGKFSALNFEIEGGALTSVITTSGNISDLSIHTTGKADGQRLFLIKKGDKHPQMFMQNLDVYFDVENAATNNILIMGNGKQEEATLLQGKNNFYIAANASFVGNSYLKTASGTVINVQGSRNSFESSKCEFNDTLVNISATTSGTFYSSDIICNGTTQINNYYGTYGSLILNDQSRVDNARSPSTIDIAITSSEATINLTGSYFVGTWGNTSSSTITAVAGGKISLAGQVYQTQEDIDFKITGHNLQETPPEYQKVEGETYTQPPLPDLNHLAIKQTYQKKNDGKQYGEIIKQYDSLIKDSSYKGINLLREQDLTVTFNENRSAQLSVQGKDASAQALGLVTTDWQNQGDVVKSIQELTDALNQIRQMSSELGNYYSIVTTRENFTQNLINVLTEGADKLTLADMNEESANMLALQTRQQLAVNSLSLASQASQSILKLF